MGCYGGAMPKRHRLGFSATSLLGYLEEVVLATSGEDAFELIFAVAAARIGLAGPPADSTIKDVARLHPELGIVVPHRESRALVLKVDSILAPALKEPEHRLKVLDAVFESLVPRLAKGDKGQFFTPRHVVDFVMRVLAPRRGETVIDPACGSGAFLARARDCADVTTWGFDIDSRAVRVARLVALSQGADLKSIVRTDGLRGRKHSTADIVATNPPFAGRADATGFELANFVRTPERDVLFVERAIDLLRPGGRLGIVLPYNKAAGNAFAAMRKWFVERAQIFAVIALPRETFLPHTSQRTFVLFAKKRETGGVMVPAERVAFVVSERSGKNSAGEPLSVRDGQQDLEHDLHDVVKEIEPGLRSEGFFA